MDFEFSAEQEALRASVRRFLAERAPLAEVRAALGSDVGADDAVWQGLAELGAVGLLVPETHGGAGAGMLDAAVVGEELGRAVSPLPYLASAVGAVSLLVGSEDPEAATRHLPGLADGSVVGSLAVLEPGRGYEWRRPGTGARRTDDGWRLDGIKTNVAHGATAELLLVVAAAPDGLGVFAADGPGVTRTPTPTVDGTRAWAAIRFDDAPARRIGGADATELVGRTLDRMGVASTVDAVGAASRALELVVAYAKEREQFGRPIGSFQAVQHLCTDMLRSVELGRAVAYYASWAADGADAAEAHRAATMAQAFAGDALARLGGDAIQVFGGIGFTWEHDIHLYYKRLLTASVAFGSGAEHLSELARIALTET